MTNIPLKAGSSAIEQRLNNAQQFINNGDLAQAETLLTSLAQENPSSAIVLQKLGAVLTMQGRNQEASQWFEKAIEGDPSFVPSYNGLAVSMLGQNKWKEAEDACKQGLKANQNFIPFKVLQNSCS